jgi:ATP-dependent Clp protease ATP-binding subunit ClpC
MDYSVSQLPNTNESLIFLREEKPSVKPNRKNIFDNFSLSALATVKEACDLAKTGGSAEATPWHLLYTLTSKFDSATLNDQGKHILMDAALKNINKDNKNFNGVVFITPELRKVLLASYFVDRQHANSPVENSHMLLALSVYPEMEDLFTSIGFVAASRDDLYLPKEVAEYVTDLSLETETTNREFISRDIEIGNIMRILSRDSRHHILLLGDEGVGKSVISRGLARYLKYKKFSNFIGVKVLSIDAGSLFSLTNTPKSIVAAISDTLSSVGKAVVFMENVYLLNTTFQIAQLTDFMQNLQKKANAYFLLPVTPAFYKENFAQNSYFTDNFETVHIEEMSEDSTVKILETEQGRITKQFKLNITPGVFKEIVTLSKRYLPGKLPQKAISLLEEAAAGSFFKNKPELSVSDVRDVVSERTGIPINSLTQDETMQLQNLEELLAEHVVGQKDALIKVSEALRRARAGLKDAKRPIGSFLFLGPTGVGKTELAKTLARLFYHDEKSFLRFDMSEYAESFTAQRLIGSPPGYVGYEEGGQLTNQVIARPYSLILFDEIEKAHPRVFDLFLQILDDGRLTDAKGTVVDFRNTLIIFTSNIASREIFENSANLVNPAFDKKSFFDSVIMKIVRTYFRPELVNRFDDIVMFNPLSKEELSQIALLKIEQLAERLKDKRIVLTISGETLRKLVDAAYDPSNGARPLEREIRYKIENPLAKKIISGEIKEGDTVSW